MNKKALKEFAVYARNELRDQFALRAQAFGIDPKGSSSLISGSDYVELNNRKYPLSYKKIFEKLFHDIKTKGYENVIEEISYTWFNRIIAIRFMEIHNYLPSKVRVLSSETRGKVDPDILTEYQYTDLPVDKDEIASLLGQGNREEAFRKLLIAQCNELSEIMPFLFEKIEDYSELLLPVSMLHADSLINRLISEIAEVDFQEVEVIGWLYQYYMSEKKEQVGGLKNNAVKKEELPVVTQLFTPRWIVEYMVQNSLGKFYDEWKPENHLNQDWEFYLQSSVKMPFPTVSSLEEIKIIDPACGSGHILVYAFEFLYELYLEAGYSEREIPGLIIEKNLYGLDIDKRAVQMASFALLMKGQEKYRRFLKKAAEMKLNIYEFVDSNALSEEAQSYLKEKMGDISGITVLQNQFENAKQFGSLIVPMEPASFYSECIQSIGTLTLDEADLLDEASIIEIREKIIPLLQQAYLLALKYEVVVTNPPYHNKFNPTLKKFMLDQYNEYKSDLYSAFIYRCTTMTVENGYSALMTPFTWMFISSHEKLRKYVIHHQSISNLVQLEYSAFTEATVPISTFVIQNQTSEPIGVFLKLEDFKGADLQPVKVKEAARNNSVYYRYEKDIRSFLSIPNSPIAYWLSSTVLHLIKENILLGERSYVKKGMFTGDNNKYIRFWHEVDLNNIGFGLDGLEAAFASRKKWFPTKKGGEYRKWYGNDFEVVAMDKKSYDEIQEGNGHRSPTLYFKPAITWSSVTSSRFSARYGDQGFINNTASMSLFYKDFNFKYILGILDSKLALKFVKDLSPTLNFTAGDIERIPLLLPDKETEEKITDLVERNIEISRLDWDSYETSWDFQRHPFTLFKEPTLEQCYEKWYEYAEKQFLELKANEEELNKTFIDFYGLQEELAAEVPVEEVTVRKADMLRDAKSFLSYCIGLKMGRYSLGMEGLTFAGGEWDADNYKTFQPDGDGIIPLTDTEYFEDDVISRLQQLLVHLFGQDTLAENLCWLAESLTMKANETPVERLRRYFFDEFYGDHCKIYQKRPIYWMAESGSKKGFRALFYLHRYTPETLATIRFTYVQNLQEKLNQEQKRLEQDLHNPDLTSAMKKRYDKQLTTIIAQQGELIEFDKKLAELANQRIALELDDGVIVNYDKLNRILAKIK